MTSLVCIYAIIPTVYYSVRLFSLTHATQVSTLFVAGVMEGAPPRKLRRRVIYQDTAAICKFPEDLLLRIFTYLDVLSILHCSCTCRLWNRLARDRTLWQNVDLIPYRLGTRALWKFVRQRCSDNLKVYTTLMYLNTI